MTRVALASEALLLWVAALEGSCLPRLAAPRSGRLFFLLVKAILRMEYTRRRASLYVLLPMSNRLFWSARPFSIFFCCPREGHPADATSM